MNYVNIDLLKPNPKNPRKISKKKLKALCDSLKKNIEYFEARPIITDKNYMIYAGHQRYKAAKELGMTEVPVHIVDAPIEKLEEIMIRDNVSSGVFDESLLAEWDFSFLEDCGIEITGFDSEEQDQGKEEQRDKKKERKVKKVITCPLCGEDFEL